MKSLVTTTKELYDLHGDEVFSCMYWKTKHRETALALTREAFLRTLDILREGGSEQPEDVLYQVVADLMTQPTRYPLLSRSRSVRAKPSTLYLIA